jgi:hypothetical protein
MSYFIIIKTAGALPTQDFSNQLLARWPRARIEKVQNPKLSDLLEFELPMPQHVLYGALDRDGKGVTFQSGSFRDCAEFAQWCRSLIPPSEEVVFCDESMGIDFILEPSMTPEEIVQAVCSS